MVTPKSTPRNISTTEYDITNPYGDDDRDICKEEELSIIQPEEDIDNIIAIGIGIGIGRSIDID